VSNHNVLLTFLIFHKHQALQAATHDVQSQTFYFATQICIARTCYGNVSVWVAGWLGVCHSRYCIKTTKSVLKFFRPSNSSITEAFGIPCADTQFQGNPFIGAFNTWGGGIGDFRWILPFISETVREIGQWLLRSVNRK